jgi:5-methylcytosine-specific restriction endonuclease McrA
MGSQTWRDRRERWLEAFCARQGSDPTCAACSGAWTLRRGDLHHRSYDRVGRERVDDLVPLCRACHDHVHRVLESTPAWRRMGREQATDLIVACISRIHLQGARRERDEGDD